MSAPNNLFGEPPVCHTQSVADLKLSVLDLAIVGEGSSHHEALTNSVDLARAAERLGYHRHWVAEHHNMPGIASSSPAGPRCRAGREHPAHPDRLRRRDAPQPPAAGGRRAVRDARGALPGPHRPRHRPRAGHRPDHGVGAAPLGRPALRRGLPPGAGGADRLLQGRVLAARPVSPRQGRARQRRYAGDLPARARRATRPSSPACSGCRSRSPTTSCRATPTPRWSSTARDFQPSEYLDEPYAIVACAAIARGRRRARSLPLRARRGCRWRGFAPGVPTRFPTPEEAAAHKFSASEEASVSHLAGSAAIGGPETVKAKLDDARAAHAGDEVMITTMVHDHADRVRSYELIAEAYELAAPVVTAGSETRMTTKADFNGEEWDQISEGPALAGLIVIASQRGGTIRETLAMAKVYAEAQKSHTVRRPAQRRSSARRRTSTQGSSPARRTCARADCRRSPRRSRWSRRRRPRRSSPTTAASR